MTHLEDKIKVMLSYSEGSNIEYCVSGGGTTWTLLTSPTCSWNWALFDYRVAQFDIGNLWGVFSNEGKFIDAYRNEVTATEASKYLNFIKVKLIAEK